MLRVLNFILDKKLSMADERNNRLNILGNFKTYLNIYQPIVASNHSLLLVFVWIHGGAHSVGCASQSIPLLFNGTNMITHSIHLING